MDSEIIVNYEEVSKDYEILTETSKDIEKQIQEFNKLNQDLGDFWVGSQHNLFKTKVEGYIEEISNTKKKLDTDAETLKKCMELYQMLDKEFANRTI